MKSKKTVTVLLSEEEIDLISNSLNRANGDGVEDITVQIEYDESKREVKSVDIAGTCREQYFETVFRRG